MNASLQPRGGEGRDLNRPFDVVVPVFNALEHLQRCVEALKQTLPSWARVVLIDDASTDIAVGQFFARLSREDLARWTFLRQPRNLGFVATVNRAMLLSDAHVVLLNSDTIPTAGWLESLRACLISDRNIGTATPFSNNAEICSFPIFCQANPVPENLTELAGVIRKLASREYPELPTGVGFCMAVSREAIDRVGVFDPAFGRGYGEENDFCRRLAAIGMRSVLCDDAYVAHVGGRSFAPLGLSPGGENMALLLQRHPEYEQLVAQFIAADPIAKIRQRIASADPGCSLGQGLQ